MKFIIYIFVCCFFANTLVKSVMNLSMDKDDLTEISVDDSEDDDTEEENVDSEDLLSLEIFSNIFAPVDFDLEKPLLNYSKDFYTYNYSKPLFAPPEFTV